MIPTIVFTVLIVLLVVGLFWSSGAEGVLDPSAPAAEDIEKARRPSLASLQAGWTPQEREAFGINETEALIERIDRELAR